MEDRIQGTVKWFNAVRSYAFNKPDDGEDVFVHFNAIQMDGYQKPVEFRVDTGPKGLQATDVVLL